MVISVVSLYVIFSYFLNALENMSLPKLGKKYVTTVYRNTDPARSVRIIISYSFVSLNPRYRLCSKIYLRLGDMVVSIPVSRQVSLIHTLRVMLTALSLYPHFLRYLPSVRSRIILTFWVKNFVNFRQRKYTRMSLMSLLSEASSSVIKLWNIRHPVRLSLTTSPNVSDLLISLHVSFVSLIQYIMRLFPGMVKDRARNLPV